MSTLSDLPFEVLSLIHSFALHGENYTVVKRNRAAWCGVCHALCAFNQPELYKTVQFALDYLTTDSYFTSLLSPDHIIYDIRISLFLRTVQEHRELGKMVTSLELSGYSLAPAVNGKSELKMLPRYLPAVQYLTLGSAERRADGNSMIDMEFLATAGRLWELQMLIIRGFDAVQCHSLLQPWKSVHFVQLDHLETGPYTFLSLPKFRNIKKWFPFFRSNLEERDQASFRKVSLVLYDHRRWDWYRMLNGHYRQDHFPFPPFNPRNLTHLHLGGTIFYYGTFPYVTLSNFPSLQRLGKAASCWSEVTYSASWMSNFLRGDVSRPDQTSPISKTRNNLQAVVLDIDSMTFSQNSFESISPDFRDLDLQARQLNLKIHIFHDAFELSLSSATILRLWELAFPHSWKAGQVIVCWRYSPPGRRTIPGVFWGDDAVEAARQKKPVE
ncbi:hypothetical protein DL96DRAFT_1824071 [Flagelloscypha sp. PMI_526]|nr:hypothetical protein DL96DRAFT_1824071 [Flagelloscypha sp. PMI_526]